MKRDPTKAFTLVEVTIAVGLLAFVALAIIGLLSVGLNLGKEAQQDTVLFSILGDTVTRIEGEDFEAAQKQYYYTQSGRMLDAASSSALWFYQVDIDIVTPMSSALPADVSEMLAVNVKVSWPYTTSGTPQEEESISYQVTPRTGTDWKRSKYNFQPRIER